MNLLDLPYTLFQEIILYLSATDTLRLRRLSTQVNQALTRQKLCITLILAHFPRSIETRILRAHIARDSQGSHTYIHLRDWAAVFARLTRRYLHLGCASPWRTFKLETLKDDGDDGWRLKGVSPWDKFLRLDNKTAPFYHQEPLWTFDPKEGLVVFVAPDGMGLQARDLGTGEQVAVPFGLDEKIIRRIRLNAGILVIEWCEEEGYHALNEREMVHRHYATAFDVIRSGPYDGTAPMRLVRDNLALWRISFRLEWKIHYLGLPLSMNDRFFSAHNAHHYVVYVWQPTRSPWGEDAPLERLVIWDIRTPSAYRPSSDPGEKLRPEDEIGRPPVIRRLTNDELSYWGLRQLDTPSIRGIFLDEQTWDPKTESACGHVYFHEEDHRWSSGPHSGPNPPRLHSVQSTGIPLQGYGPRWEDECGGSGHGGLNFCWRGPRRPSQESLTTANGFCHGEEELLTWPGKAPCWRHDDFPYLTVSEIYDAGAGVRISARHCFMLETLSVHVRPKLRVAGPEWPLGDCGRVTGSGTRIEGPDGDEVQFGDEWWGEMMGKGIMMGDERWIVGEDAMGDITVMLF